MIVTFTANPSVDRTVALRGPLVRGGVQPIASVTDQPGGKGLNVAGVLALAGVDARAVLSIADAAAPRPGGLPVVAGSEGRLRVNLTLTEPDGTTTKLNEPGSPLRREQVDAAADLLVRTAAGASWVVLSGSLPPGAPGDWYASLGRAARGLGCRVALDASGAALRAAVDGAAFDLVKPNAEELAGLVGGDGAAWEDAAASGDWGAVVTAARSLLGRAGAVLVTLGRAGGVLATPDGAWCATASETTVASTVGAGDCALAGYLLADAAGADPAGRLASAVAYGTAAVGLPGSTWPRPEDVRTGGVRVTRWVPDGSEAPGRGGR